jgi:hypothetical protein
MISIKVSKKYKNDKLNDLLQKDDININQTILDYGVSLYNNQSDIVKHYSIDNEVKLKNDELESLKNEIKKISKSYEESIKVLKDEKEKQTNNELKLKNDQIDSLKNENKKITNIYEETIKSLKDDKDKEISNELKLKNEQLDSLKNEIVKIKNIYDNTIKSLKTDKEKEYEQYKLNKEKEINDLLLEKKNYENNLNLNFKSKEFELNSIITKLNEEKDNIYEKFLEDKRNLEKTYRETFYKKESEYDNIINNIQNEKLSIREQYFKDIKEIELKLNNQYQDKINSLESNIEKLQNEKVINISSLIEQGKRLSQEDYDKYIKLHEQHNNQLKTNYENQIKDINDKNNKLIDKINDLDVLIRNLHANNHELTNKLFDINKMQENNKYDSLINNFSVLNQKLGDNFDRFFRDNTSKGIIGEDFIETFLSESFSNCKIFNFTKEFGKGDFLFVLNESKILIEAKNVQTLKKEDIDKFYRDIDIQHTKGTINAGLLISLNDTNLINGKRLFHIEIKNSIPIIMISNAFKMTEYIRFSILIINYLIKIGICNNNESDDEKLSFIINSINEIYCFFKIQINYLNNDKQMLLKIEQSYNKREVDLFNIDKLMKNIFAKYPEMYIKDTVSNNNDNIESIINKIDEHIKTLEHNTEFKITIKNLEEIGIPKNIIRNIGGLKNITDYYNKK